MVRVIIRVCLGFLPLERLVDGSCNISWTRKGIVIDMLV